jgi:hypothetical protein
MATCRNPFKSPRARRRITTSGSIRRRPWCLIQSTSSSSRCQSRSTTPEPTGRFQRRRRRHRRRARLPNHLHRRRNRRRGQPLGSQHFRPRLRLRNNNKRALHRASGLVHQSPSGCRFTTRIRARIVNRPPGFSAIAAANAARARASERQIASVSRPLRRHLAGLRGVAAGVPQPYTRGTRSASNSAMMLAVVSS